MKLNFEKESFEKRHIGVDQEELNTMLKHIGVSSLDQLIEETIPADIRLKSPLNLPAALSENEYLQKIKKIAAKNQVYDSYIGMGYYDCITPSVILRNVMENPGWYTPYTPYQAEIAQGRLEGLLNFQTMVMELTGMELANASLLDEGTAAAEAMAMLFSKKKNRDANKFFVDEECYPQTIDVLESRAEHIGIELVFGDPVTTKFDSSYFAVLLQYPGGHGDLIDYNSVAAKAKKENLYIAVASDLMALVLLTPPSSFGADVVVGTSQRFGVPMGFGGPHAAFFATHDEFKRNIPGRVIGVSIDAEGNQALRMALQTREQHIRRDKATSNICTAQALLANMAAFYAVYHGPKGLQRIAERIHSFTCVLNAALGQLGYKQLNKEYFDTLKIELNPKLVELHVLQSFAEKAEVNLRYYNDGFVGVSLDETTNRDRVLKLISVFAEAVHKTFDKKDLDALMKSASSPLKAGELRNDQILQQEVFNKHHSETEMMRYLKYLENKDLGLNTSMIPLGSCTMKLNAASEMMPVTWTEFGALHPFAPISQATGYYQVFEELSHALCEITGFDQMSLQPNAGAQGEYAGLLVIKKYLESNGQNQRDICLIPASAHGTNPASAVMAGMKVVVVQCDNKGNVDLTDLENKLNQYKDSLAALMITYPSTHGVYETAIRKICSMVHDFGGQVYMDGANMNAQVGLTSPSNIGADVCHLNLHKTFCIPHGGGGPGMGPIGVAKHLSPFLPGHFILPGDNKTQIKALASAPFSSSSILLISYAYICMMGGEGLTMATKIAIANANYIASRLESSYPILYKGHKGRIAHEMIVDCRSFKAEAGIEVEDIAKRLIDYGFHAPTVSFPVAGTLMIEPTESEDKGEIDRFCDAMVQIRREIDAIAQGKADKSNNVLKNAPHTQNVICANEWNRPYSRKEAAYPLSWIKNHKFWPAVARIDNTYGDRNLVCSCTPLSEYVEQANTTAELTA